MIDSLEALRRAYVCCPVLYALARQPDGMNGYDLKKMLRTSAKEILHSLVALRDLGLVESEITTVPRLPREILIWKITNSGQVVIEALDS